MNYITFLYADENDMVYAFSLLSNDLLLGNFSAFLDNYIEKVADFYTLRPDSSLRQRIVTTCPMGSGQELGRNNDDTLREVGSGIGSVFGAISSLIPTDKINEES